MSNVVFLFQANKTKIKMIEKMSSTGGWFSGWFGKSKLESTSSVSSDNSDKLQNTFNQYTQEEKEMLYKAIGYTEESKKETMPKEYVSLFLNVELKKITFSLFNGHVKYYTFINIY